MYALDGPALVADLSAFWHEVKNYFPSQVTLQAENSGDELQDTTGNVIGAWTTGVQAVKVGVSTAKYPAPSGVCINWYTSTWIDGRRLKGKSYLVPAKGEMYDVNGTLEPTAKAGLEAEVTTFLANTATNLLVWHRPTTPGGTDGASAAVTSAVIADKAAVLRSRRD